MNPRETRRASQSLVASYHEARLADLIERVANSLDDYRAGEADA